MLEELLKEIRERIAYMPPQQQNVGNYFCDHPEDLGRLTMIELAQKIGTSEPTLIRFCRSLGYTGFRDFTRRVKALRHEKKSYATSFNDTRVQYRKNEGLLNQARILLEKVSRNARRLVETFSTEKIANCVELMRESSSIVIIGRMNSFPAAVYFEQLLFMTTQKVFPMNESDAMQVTAISRMDKKSLVFCIAFPRTPKVVLDMARRCRQKGATIITIAGNELSPLAEISDLILTVDIEMFSYIDMFVPIFVLIDIICLEFSISQGEQSEKSLMQYDNSSDTFYVEDRPPTR